MDVDAPVAEARLPPKMRKGWIARNAARLRERTAHRESREDIGVDSPLVDSGDWEGRGDIKQESYFGA